MKRYFLALVAIFSLAVEHFGQTLPIYINNDNLNCLTNAPQINARIFLNNGTFCNFGSIPYDFLNTTIYTNNGILTGSVGYWFDTVTDSGARGPASRFVNTRRGTVSATDGIVFIGLSGNTYDVRYGSTLWIRADEIINESGGTLSVGPAGLLRVQGRNVVLNNSVLQVDPPNSLFCNFGFQSLIGSSIQQGFVTATNFVPDIGITDVDWGMDNSVTNFDVSQIVVSPNPLIVQSPPYMVTNASGVRIQTQMLLQNPTPWVQVSQPNPSNLFVHATFVKTGSTNVAASVQLLNAIYPGFNQTRGPAQTILVGLSANTTNLVTGLPSLSTVYIVDQLLNNTNFVLTTNLLSDGFRPSPFILSRTPPCDFGVTPPSTLPPGLFYGPTFSNMIVTNLYAAYDATVDNLIAQVPMVPGASVTNRPGRIEIFADNLDLTRTRMRGEGIIQINATNFLGSSNAIVDVPNINLNLTAPTSSTAANNGKVNIKSLVRDTVDRFTGGISIWSGGWTNQIVDPITTNVTTITYHMLMVDATLMTTIKPVVVNSFTARASTAPSLVTISDNMNVTDSLLVDAANLTVQGGLSLGQAIKWDARAFPRVNNLTNNGAVSVTSGLADIGHDRVPYGSIVNGGSFSAFGYLVNSDYFENSGIWRTEAFTYFLNPLLPGIPIVITNFLSNGAIDLKVNTAKLDGQGKAAARLETAGDVKIEAKVAKFNQHTINASGALYLSVSDTLEDSGPAAQNFWNIADGVNIASPQPKGDLLGTTIQSRAARFSQVPFRWPAADRGATALGFTNNLALGKLVLVGDLFSQFIITGAGTGNALYVDLIEVGGETARNLTDSVDLQGLDVYFAGIQSADPQFTITAEDVDFELSKKNPAYPTGRTFGGGKMHWVRDFAGPNSSVEIPLTSVGPTIRVNRALRESPVLDSDGDGIANREDEFPFEIRVQGLVIQKNPAKISFSWQAFPSRSYIIEYAADLTAPTWTQLSEYRQGPIAGTATFDTPVDPGQAQRYYRVRFKL